jgi:hypothetical protein
MSKKLLISIISCILVLGTSSCGYDGHYRYACQDPSNWGAPECNPPFCETNGTCTKYIVKDYEDIIDEQE